MRPSPDFMERREASLFKDSRVKMRSQMLRVENHKKASITEVLELLHKSRSKFTLGFSATDFTNLHEFLKISESLCKSVAKKYFRKMSTEIMFFVY